MNIHPLCESHSSLFKVRGEILPFKNLEGWSLWNSQWSKGGVCRWFFLWLLFWILALGFDWNEHFFFLWKHSRIVVVGFGWKFDAMFLPTSLYILKNQIYWALMCNSLFGASIGLGHITKWHAWTNLQSLEQKFARNIESFCKYEAKKFFVMYRLYRVFLPTFVKVICEINVLSKAKFRVHGFF